MNKNIIIKKAQENYIENEIKAIGFDKTYYKKAAEKYNYYKFRLFNLKPVEANILKQLCLSIGFDCAVSRETVSCKCDYTDCLIAASKAQFKKLIVKLQMQPFRLNEIAGLIKEQINTNIQPIKFKTQKIDWSKPYIMGILNITPDSFSDGGEYNSIDKAVEKALSMKDEGVDILDIGGESTRPHAQEVAINEEIERVIPTIKAIRAKISNILISIDTRNYQTARLAIEAGANIINDVSGLEHDSNLLEYVCQNNIPTVIMHSNKVPAESSLEAHDSEKDVVVEIYKYFIERISLLKAKGLQQKNIIIDPGIGFGKSITDNFKILKRIEEFSSLKCPILVGLSRKSFISKTFNLTTNEELDKATLAYDSYLFTKGVNILRTHEVKEHKKNVEFLDLVL